MVEPRIFKTTGSFLCVVCRKRMLRAIIAEGSMTHFVVLCCDCASEIASFVNRNPEPEKPK